MKIVGIVAEYDPFHSGHRYQIETLRAKLGEECAVVCAMSGNWTQRGGPALVDKWTRAELALHGGADLIVELPTPWATASAETFARGGVEILSRCGADILCFGSESGDLDELKRAADCLDSEDYRTALKAQLEGGLSFAVARQQAVEQLIGPTDCLAHPNNNLGIEYLRANRRQGSPMEVLTVRRFGDAHNAPASGTGHASASAIRALLRSGDETGLTYLPPQASSLLNRPFSHYERAFPAVLARLRTMDRTELAALPDCGEGLEKRILDAAGRAESLESLFDLAKSKRYAHARIRRVVLRAFLGLTEIPGEVPYLRVLGANGRGRAILKSLRDEAVLTKSAHGRGIPLLEAEARWTDLYALCFDPIRPAGLEWTTSPVMLP